MLNVEEIKSIVKFIEAEPDMWNQDLWVDGVQRTRISLSEPLRPYDVTEVYAIVESCATACCVAGHAVMRAGLAYAHGHVFNPATGEVMGEIQDVARDLLGLSQMQSNAIFASDGGNNVTTEEKIGNLKDVISRVTCITFD